MNYLDHEYLVPIIIGSGRAATACARRISKNSGRQVHLFADSFGFLHKLFYRCHKVSPVRDELIIESLTAFAESLEDYFCPVVFVCDSFSREFVEKHSEFVESLVLVQDVDELS